MSKMVPERFSGVGYTSGGMHCYTLTQKKYVFAYFMCVLGAPEHIKAKDVSTPTTITTTTTTTALTTTTTTVRTFN